MSHDGKEPRRDAQLAPLDVIRVETALSRFPVHRLAKSGTVRIELRETNDNGEMTLRWEVSHNSKYGQPGPLAYKIDTLVVSRRLEDAGRPIPRIIRLGSLKEVAQQLDLGGDTNKVKHALYQNAFAAITAKIRYKSVDGTERRIEIGDTRYAVVFTGETLPDGRTADAVYIVLHDFYREILDNAPTRPLDFDYLRELPPAPQRLYELLSYPMFGAIKHGRSRARLVYSELCACGPQTRYFDWEHARKQMAKVHAPHRKSGYITDVEFEARTAPDGRPDWLMHYTPGPKARAEYQAFTKKDGPAVLEAEPMKPEPEPEPAGLVKALVDRGVNKSIAAELAKGHAADLITAKIAELDWLRERHPRKVRDAGAYLVTSIRKDYATPTGFRAEAERVDRARSEAERRRDEAEAKAREREDDARVESYWSSLSRTEQAQIEATALGDAAKRAEYDSLPGPLKGAYQKRLREKYLRTLLGLPAAE